MTEEERLAKTLEREYYAQLAANHAAEERGEPVPNEWLTTLRRFLQNRGFSAWWLTRHGYTDNQAKPKPEEE